MKLLLSLMMFVFCLQSHSQNLQLVYDIRHSLDPSHQAKNFPTLYFEYFKEQDSGRSVIKPGAFLFKMQSDLMGSATNIGKTYMQVAQTLRCWTPKIFLHLSYSGGLGVTEPKEYSYYILNTYAAGVAYPFQWKGGYFSIVLDYKYVAYPKPSSDLLWTLYFYKAFLNYRLEIMGDFNVWTENKNHGDAQTSMMTGKRLFFFGEPQLWYRLKGRFSAGARINMFYNVNTTDDSFQLYPALGIKWKIAP